MSVYLTSTAKAAVIIAVIGGSATLWAASSASAGGPKKPTSETTEVMDKMVKDEMVKDEMAKGSMDEMAKDEMVMDKMDKPEMVAPVAPPRPQNDWGVILQKHAVLGADGLVRFDYGALKASRSDTAKLAAYIDDLAAQKPSTFERKQAMSYWANLYNAVTVQVVVENYPVSSIMKIRSGLRPGPWKRKLVTVEGEELSLDNIEHDIMRPTYKTPLVHYMVNCASIGCPNLKPTPWAVENFDADMDVAARAYINSPRGVVVENGKVTASKIYKWFKEDFGGNPAGVLKHAREYADPALLAQLEGKTKIKSYIYDWKINTK